MPIHLGRRASLEGWVSFESDPLLRRTKERLNTRCLPCMTSLWEQLKGQPHSVRLNEALDCWKVVVAMKRRDDCLHWLARFAEAYPDEDVYGKFGKGAGGHTTFAVIFHTETDKRRDQLMALAKQVCESGFPGAEPVFSRGCGIPYEQLLGPWQGWRATTPIAHPERITSTKKSLRQSLFRA